MTEKNEKKNRIKNKIIFIIIIPDSDPAPAPSPSVLAVPWGGHAGVPAEFRAESRRALVPWELRTCAEWNLTPQLLSLSDEAVPPAHPQYRIRGAPASASSSCSSSHRESLLNPGCREWINFPLPLLFCPPPPLVEDGDPGPNAAGLTRTGVKPFCLFCASKQITGSEPEFGFRLGSCSRLWVKVSRRRSVCACARSQARANLQCKA